MNIKFVISFIDKSYRIGYIDQSQSHPRHYFLNDEYYVVFNNKAKSRLNYFSQYTQVKEAIKEITDNQVIISGLTPSFVS
jgi:hypothetical protein